MKFDSVDAILDFAIGKEEDAAQFYTDLAGKMKQAHMKDLFEQFALEEKSHKAKLEKVKEGKLLLSAKQKIMDLKVVDHLDDTRFDEGEFDFQSALLAAMNAEKASFRLYNDLAKAADKPDIKETFMALAQEEAKHKLMFEIEYDEKIYAEN
jgi:rubrerythrin